MANSNKLLKLIVFAIALAVAFVILKPFLTAIVFAAVVAFLLFPAHKVLRKRITEFGSAALLAAIVLAISLAVLAFGVRLILSEFGRVFFTVSGADFTKLFPEQPELANSLKELSRFIVQKSIESFTNFVTQLPKMVLSFFVFIISTFFFLRDGERLYSWILRVTPLRKSLKSRIYSDIKKYAKSFINVWFLIGIIQAIVAVIGFMLFKQPYPALAGISAFILSVIPILGVYLLYFIAGGIIILEGDVNTGGGLLLYGLALGSFFDYVVRPYYAGKWAKVHPLVILLGIFGGAFILGPAGIIVGPVILLVIAALLHSASVKNG